MRRRNRKSQGNGLPQGTSQDSETTEPEPSEAEVSSSEPASASEQEGENTPAEAPEGPGKTEPEKVTSTAPPEVSEAPSANPAPEAKAAVSAPDASPPAEPEEPIEPWVVVRFTGREFAGTLGGHKVRHRIYCGATLSIPESALDEAREKGWEFVRAAKG